MNTKNLLKKAIEKRVSEFFETEAVFEVTRPKEEKFGDFTSNVAMLLAKSLKKPPLEIADKIAKALEKEIENLKKIEVVNPGYINFYFSQEYFSGQLVEILENKENFGASKIGQGIKINNEFISANPTGPLTVGNGRGGFCGDVLTRVLRKSGFDVVSEYYINDAGGQVEKLGHSVLKDEKACYSGEYIDTIAEDLKNESDDARKIGSLAAEIVMEKIIKRVVAEKMKINFDIWASEKEIQKSGYVDRALEILKGRGFIYESEGALWLRTSDFGDDKDRVVVKKDGQKAYFAGDCGYMLQKIERGFEKIIFGLGADHHGYTQRMKALALALGFTGEVRFVISQLVRVIKDGKEVRMSKRAGNVVYIEDLIDNVGHDVARFFFLMYSPDSHMNFDLGLAKESSQKNPIFYVQYAHARICSVLRKGRESGFYFQASDRENFSLLSHEKEISLIREMEAFPDLIEEISASYEVHKLSHYAIKLADKFHSFYNNCQVIDEKNPELTKARLGLITAVKIVLGETLFLIGVGSPEKM